MYLKDHSIQTAKNILIRFPKKMLRFFSFLKEANRFKNKSDGRFSVNLKNIYPCLADKVVTTPFDAHYIYHPAWAARVLVKTQPTSHVDFSSILSFSTIVSAFIPTKFYDYRPAKLNLSNYDSEFADLTQLPFKDNQLPSISCMHTIEHIGLGRYGDPIDPTGDIKAANELKRVIEKNGDLLFVTPVGKQRIEFNAHRIYGYETIIKMFEGCELIEFSLVTDNGQLITNANPSMVAQQNYGCGCFWFKKQ